MNDFQTCDFRNSKVTHEVYKYCEDIADIRARLEGILVCDFPSFQEANTWIKMQADSENYAISTLRDTHCET